MKGAGGLKIGVWAKSVTVPRRTDEGPPRRVPLTMPRRFEIRANRVPWCNSLFAMELGVAKRQAGACKDGPTCKPAGEDLRKGRAAKRKKGDDPRKRELRLK